MPTALDSASSDLPYPSMAHVTALKRAEHYLANIAANSTKFNIFVSLRNSQNVLKETQISAETNNSRSSITGYLRISY